MSRSACSRWCVIVGWAAASAASSALFVAATGAADALVERCGWASSLDIWGVALLAAPLAGIVWDAYRCAGMTWGKRYREDIVPFLCITFPVYVFVVAHMVGWACVYDTSTPYVAALASVVAVLSGAMFGVYYDVYGMREKGPPWRIVTSVLAVAALAYYVFQVTVGWDSSYEVVRQSFVVIAMVVMAMAVGIFGAGYGRNRGQRRIRWWLLPVAFIVVGAPAFYTASSQNSWSVGDDDYAYLYIVQSIWAGVTVGGVMLGALAAAGFPKKSPWVWVGPVIMLAALAAPYHYISNDWMCLVSVDGCAEPSDWVKSMRGMDRHNPDGNVVWRMQVYLAILLSFLIVFVAMAAAMLGAAVASRIRPEQDGAPPRDVANDARNGTAGPSLARPIRLYGVARRDDAWGILQPFVMRPLAHIP